LKFKEKAITSS